MPIEMSEEFPRHEPGAVRRGDTAHPDGNPWINPRCDMKRRSGRMGRRTILRGVMGGGMLGPHPAGIGPEEKPQDLNHGGVRVPGHWDAPQIRFETSHDQVLSSLRLADRGAHSTRNRSAYGRRLSPDPVALLAMRMWEQAAMTVVPN